MISSSRNARERFRARPRLTAKSRARVVDPMTSMVFGKMMQARGCCPVCGRDVELKQSFNGRRLRESYGCFRCGPTTYVAVA